MIEGGYELIQGFRRVGAVRELLKETGEARCEGFGATFMARGTGWSTSIGILWTRTSCAAIFHSRRGPCLRVVIVRVHALMPPQFPKPLPACFFLRAPKASLYNTFRVTDDLS